METEFRGKMKRNHPWGKRKASYNVFNTGGRKQRPITLATSLGKTSKAEAEYVDYSRKQHCEDCNMFRPPAGCITVAGVIDPEGTCRFWEAKD
jgi:hypothetical protein